MEVCSICKVEIEIDEELSAEELKDVQLFCRVCYEKSLLENAQEDDKFFTPIKPRKTYLH